MALVLIVVDGEYLKEKELYLPDILDDSLAILRVEVIPRSSDASNICIVASLELFLVGVFVCVGLLALTRTLFRARGAPQPFISHPLSSGSETELRSRLLLPNFEATAWIRAVNTLGDPSLLTVEEAERDGLRSNIFLSSSSVRQSSAG